MNQLHQHCIHNERLHITIVSDILFPQNFILHHFRKSLNVPTVRFKQGKKLFLSVMIIYLGFRNLMWTRKKQIIVNYNISVTIANCGQLFGESYENDWAISRSPTCLYFQLSKIMRNGLGSSFKKSTFYETPKRVKHFSINIHFIIS